MQRIVRQAWFPEGSWLQTGRVNAVDELNFDP
jgi:hypothetical protein